MWRSAAAASLAIVAMLTAGAPPLEARALPARALTWADVSQAYAAVHDYTARYEKEERAIDHGEIQWIDLKFRKPLDVRMDWLDRNGKVDQTAVYRQGLNDGKLVAHRNGMLGSMVGTVHLDPHDKRAMEDSRHPITEVGIGYIVEQVSEELAHRGVRELADGDDTLDGRPATRWSFTAAAGANVLGVPGATRAVIWIDHGLNLPVKVELRDASGAMIERHHFKDLRINVGLTDAVFTL
jgi:outer membrane lipoprotein-sorting protein